MSINFPSNLGKGQIPPSESPLNIPGIGHLTPSQEQTIRNLLNIMRMDIQNHADKAVIEKHFGSNGDFTKILRDVGITDSRDIDTVFEYVKEATGLESSQTIVTEPEDKALPSLFQLVQEQANAQSSMKVKDLPGGLTEAQKAMINQIGLGMSVDKVNYEKSLANYEKQNATPAEIYAFKQKTQHDMDAQFSVGPPPGSRRASLIAVGLKDPQLTQVIQYLMQQAGFDPPVDDMATNFKEELTKWASDPSRTVGEKQFVGDILKLFQPGMSNEQIQSVMNKFLGDKDKNIFKLYGFDPKNFQAISAMLPGVHVTFPIPTDIENAYVQTYKLNAAWGKKIRNILDKYPNDFAGFKAFVQRTILSHVPPHYRDLVAELSGNQPVNKNLPVTRADGSALFTYENNSGVPDSQVYINVIGVNPNTGKQCFIQYDRNGNPHYIDAKPGMNSQDYAFPLSYFNKSADGKGASFYLPSLEGGRIYTSIGEPLKFNVDSDGGIISPNPHQLDDPNNALLWDKVEFTIEAYRDQAHQGMIFLNATAVDNVTLPLIVNVVRKDGSVHEGGLTHGVFDALVNRLNTLGKPWTGVILDHTVLSIMDGASTGSFPQDFFVKPQKGETKSWMDGFIEKYSKTSLQISTNDSITPGDDGKGMWRGAIDPKTRKMVFTRTPPGQPSPPAINQVSITIPDKTSELLSGTGDGWEMGSVQKMTNELCSRGLATGPKLVNGNWIPAFSDERIQEIINALPDSNPNKAPLQQAYREMKIQINLARDISVGVCTNTLGAKSDLVLSNRFCQLAQDGQLPNELLNGRKQVNGNWTPPLTSDQIKETLNKLPDSNPLKHHLQFLQEMMSGTPEAPLCQDTFTGAFQTSYAYNPNMPAYAQFIDPVAGTVAANAVKAKGHEDDRLGDIYTNSYTDSTGHEGAANAVPSQFQSGFIALGSSGPQTSWTS